MALGQTDFGVLLARLGRLDNPAKSARASWSQEVDFRLYFSDLLTLSFPVISCL